jgi:uncharacterized repeat protein (TIGR04076 family)
MDRRALRVPGTRPQAASGMRSGTHSNLGRFHTMQQVNKIIMILMTKGNFSTWMKDGGTFITCCTDGIKPVVFRIERIEG